MRELGKYLLGEGPYDVLSSTCPIAGVPPFRDTLIKVVSIDRHDRVEGGGAAQ